jgi:hypothetical protein
VLLLTLIDSISSGERLCTRQGCAWTWGSQENNRHVNRLDRLVGGRRNNRERRLPLTGLRLPYLEESGEEE